METEKGEKQKAEPEQAEIVEIPSADSGASLLKSCVCHFSYYAPIVEPVHEEEEPKAAKASPRKPKPRKLRYQRQTETERERRERERERVERER